MFGHCGFFTQTNIRTNKRMDIACRETVASDALVLLFRKWQTNNLPQFRFQLASHILLP